MERKLGTKIVKKRRRKKKKKKKNYFPLNSIEYIKPTATG
jgi:hypothetical protein